MSVHNNYDATSSTYDDTRRPVGSDVIAGMTQVYCEKKMQEMHVLDAGCGTGNYSKDLLEMGLGHVTMLDASEGMLNKARVKMEPFKDKVTIKQGVLPGLPFPNGTFDMVMFNLVLHHLVKEDTEFPFEKITLTLNEAHRVLAPGGLLVISAALGGNMRDLLWYTKLNESLTTRFEKKYLPLSDFKTMFKKAQFSFKRAVNILGMEGLGQYEDIEGPLKPEWRGVNSYWSTATDDEIREVEEKVTQLKKDGKLEDYFKEHDKTEFYGGLTFLFCVKQ